MRFDVRFLLNSRQFRTFHCVLKLTHRLAAPLLTSRPPSKPRRRRRGTGNESRTYPSHPWLRCVVRGRCATRTPSARWYCSVRAIFQLNRAVVRHADNCLGVIAAADAHTECRTRRTAADVFVTD